MISCSISAAVLGRPALRAWLPSYLLAISLRYHRSNVSGVTRVPISKSPLRPIFLAGGSTHLCKVQEGVQSYFGKAGSFDLDPTEVIALGASQHP